MSTAVALLLLGVALHVLFGVFWTGSTFVLARFGPEFGGLRLRRVQLLAATAAVLLGVWLWLGRRSEWGPIQAKAMMVGALAAFVAAGLQSALGLSAARQVGGPNTPAAIRRLRAVDWTAAVLLGVAVCAMVLARYV